jgi:hypothetical protein
MTLQDLLNQRSEINKKIIAHCIGSAEMEVMMAEQTAADLGKIIDCGVAARAAGEAALVTMIQRLDTSPAGSPTPWPVSKFLSELVNGQGAQKDPGSLQPTVDELTEEPAETEKKILDVCYYDIVAIMDRRGCEHDRATGLPQHCVALLRGGNIETLSWNLRDPEIKMVVDFLEDLGDEHDPMDVLPDNALVFFIDERPHRVFRIPSYSGTVEAHEIAKMVERRADGWDRSRAEASAQEIEVRANGICHAVGAGDRFQDLIAYLHDNGTFLELGDPIPDNCVYSPSLRHGIYMKINALQLNADEIARRVENIHTRKQNRELNPHPGLLCVYRDGVITAAIGGEKHEELISAVKQKGTKCQQGDMILGNELIVFEADRSFTSYPISKQTLG